ncbi:MAG TPA: hypothetical protein VFI84_00680 [Candidatus Saccharimonadales bacterium]|nr:hypothetical protein [Candidatus Saccharimonadales bacterium]
MPAKGTPKARYTPVVIADTHTSLTFGRKSNKTRLPDGPREELPATFAAPKERKRPSHFLKEVRAGFRLYSAKVTSSSSVLLKVGSTAAKLLKPIAYHLKPLFKPLASLWRAPVVIRTRKVVAKILFPISYFLVAGTKRALRFVQSWPVWLRRGVSAALVISLITGGYLYVHNQQYKLSTAEQKLLALPSVDLKMVKETKDGFTYNHAAEQKVDGHSITTAAAPADSTGKFPYEVTLPHNESAGIKFSDSSGDLSFTMKPNFSTAAGREDKGRVIYPEGLNSVHAYTFKRNGIKEDIILSKAPSSDTYTKTWTLNLGDKLEAKMLPNGAIGIYSADSMLFGNVQASDAKDQALIDKARKNGQKTNLAFVIPAPYVTDTNGQKDYQNIKFNLNGNVLKLTVRGMKVRTYPLSIDPTLVVTTTADFLTGMDDDGMIDWTTSGQINRNDLGYGMPITLVQQTSAFTTSRQGNTSAVYNGYLYIVGGYNGASTYYNDISYCPFNTDGSVGTCTQQTNAFTTGRYAHTTVAYNGYLYIVGGYNGSGAGTLNDIQYCPLNANGSVGACTQQTNAFTTARNGHSSVVYNGFLYIIGGTDISGVKQNDIQYCPLNANGSVGTCTQQTNAFTTPRYYHTSVINNGYLYIIGGQGSSNAAGCDSGGFCSDIIYCPFNTDGSVGTCTQQTSAFTAGRDHHATIAYKGYMYISGGQHNNIDTLCNPSANTNCTDIMYCPFNSNGSVGACTQQISAFSNPRYWHTSVIYQGYFYIIGGIVNGTLPNDIWHGSLGKYNSLQLTTTQQSNAFTTARWEHTSIAYNGYLYIIGGCSDSGCGVFNNDIQYCAFSSSGSVGGCTRQTSAFTSARGGHTSVVYNGYLYIIGGNAGGTLQNDIQYCPLNTNGSVGACTQQTNAFTTARWEFASVVYNGYLYIVGGYGSGGVIQNDIQYCPLNANGSVGACTRQTNAFTSARYGFASVVYNGYLYIIGGYDNVTQYNDIQYCPLNSNGSAGTCTQQTNAFTTGRAYLSSTVNGNLLYIIGGQGGSNWNDIQYCPLNSNGSAGTCTQQTNAFTTGRYGHTSIINNGYLYIVGGIQSSTPLNDIQYEPITGGTLGLAGGTTQQTSAFTSARWGQAAVVYKGYLYISGGSAAANATGCDSSGKCNDLQACPINSDGSIGSCTQKLSAFSPARYFHSSVAYEGYVYIIGGFGAPGTGCGGVAAACGDIWRCPVNGSTMSACTQQTSAFTTARYEHSSVIYNNYLYIIGGSDNSGTALNDIQYCPVGTSAAVGSCTQQTTAFTSARGLQTSAVNNGYLYIIGGSAASSATGCNSSGYCNDIQYCPLNSNGSVGTCTQQKNAFAVPRFGHSTIVANGYLYIVGGYNGSGLNDIQSCPINLNGSVGTCNQQASAFTTARYYLAAGYMNGYLYIVGGNGGGVSQNDIQRLPLTTRGFGSLGAATQQTNAFTTARDHNTSVVYKGYLYIIGGKDNSGIRQNDIQYCPINANGSVGTCTQQTNAFTIRYRNATVVANGYIYIIGGTNTANATGCDANANCNDIQYCPINANGSVGTCTQQTNAFTTPRYGLTAATYNNYIYIIAGIGAANATGCDSNTYCNDIQYCPLNANGSVGTCTQQTNAITAGRDEHASIAVNGYLYIAGGNNNFSSGSGCLGLCDDIAYCPLNANGSVGTCIEEFNALGSPREGLSLAAYNGYLYVVGGFDQGVTGSILNCPINTNGSTGTCANQSTAFTGRYDGAATVANGYLYNAGGSNGNTQNDIQYLPINGPPLKAKYERVMDIGYLSQNLASVIYNGATNCSASLSYKTADASGVFGSATTITNTTAGTSYNLNVANKRYLWLSITMDDSLCGTSSNVTDITLTYTGYPAAPTLSSPGVGATGVSTAPTFQFRSTDPNNDYLRYKIDVCSASDCSSIVRTIDQTASQTGWSGQDAQTGTAYVGSSTITSSTMANHTYQATLLSPGTQYWWRAYAIDPGGDNIWSSASAIQAFTTNYAPAAPTLIEPANSAVGISTSSASFKLRASDSDNDYLKYKIQICSDASCNTVVQTFDQASSQSNWFGQDTQGATAYVGNSNLANSTIATYGFQSPSLQTNTQYWWRAYAIDPGGSNSLSSPSGINTFTTASGETFLRGGFNLNGGVRFGP